MDYNESLCLAYESHVAIVLALHKSLGKTLKDSNCASYMILLHNYLILTVTSISNSLYMRVSTT